jgi:hypothetical protein
MNWGFDTDYFRTRLEGGRTYTVSAHTVGEHTVSVVDTRNRVVARTFGNELAGVRVPATGTYYVAVSVDEGTGPYTLSLTTP